MLVANISFILISYILLCTSYVTPYTTIYNTTCNESYASWISPNATLYTINSNNTSSNQVYPNKWNATNPIESMTICANWATQLLSNASTDTEVCPKTNFTRSSKGESNVTHHTTAVQVMSVSLDHNMLYLQDSKIPINKCAKKNDDVRFPLVFCRAWEYQSIRESTPCHSTSDSELEIHQSFRLTTLYQGLVMGPFSFALQQNFCAGTTAGPTSCFRLRKRDIFNIGDNIDLEFSSNDKHTEWYIEIPQGNCLDETTPIVKENQAVFLPRNWGNIVSKWCQDNNKSDKSIKGSGQSFDDTLTPALEPVDNATQSFPESLSSSTRAIAFAYFINLHLILFLWEIVFTL